MKELLADVLLIIKASGARTAHVKTEGLEVVVEFPVEGPDKLDPRAPEATTKVPQRPRFRTD